MNTSHIIFGSLMGVALLSGLVLSGSLASADTDSTDEITITVPTSCSMSSSGTDSHAAEIGNGQSNSTIGETTITTYCNDNEGFAIYAIGYTGDTLGNTVLTDISLGSTHDIVTGTATSGNASNWAMKLSTISNPAPNFPIIISGTTSDTLKEQGDPDFSNFQQVPDNYTKVAYRTSSTDVGTNAEGSILKTTYQVYISPTQSAGAYQGKVKYVLVYPHNGDAPQLSFCSSHTCMQDLTSSTIATLLPNVHSTATVYDKRDEHPYTIAKLADGRYWMTENLDLAGGTALSADDTDVTSTYISNYTSSTDESENGRLIKNNNKLVLPASAIKNSENNNLTDYTQFSDSDYSYVFNSGNTDCDPQDQDRPCYSYYSWNAATLGSGRNLATDGADAEQSICPRGWKLPTAYGYYIDDWQTTSDFYLLAHQYGLDSTTEDHYYYETGEGFYAQAGPNTIPNFQTAGSYGGGNFSGSLDGEYWSSTSYDDTSQAINFFFNDYNVYTADRGDYYRNEGMSVRCLFKGTN